MKLTLGSWLLRRKEKKIAIFYRKSTICILQNGVSLVGGHALYKMHIVAFLYRIDHFHLFDVRANKLKLVLLHTV